MKNEERLLANLRQLHHQNKRQLLRGPHENLQFRRFSRHEPQTEQIGEPNISEVHWGRHALLLADSGAGKTNIIRWRIMQLLPRIAAGKASLILLDPMDKGVLTEELLWLRLVYDMRERVVLIQPYDPNVSINIFRLSDDSPQAIGETIGRVERTFGTIALGLTKLQEVAFKFSLRALFAVEPPRTVRTFQTILEEGISGLAIDRSKLSEGTLDYFQNYKRTERANETVARLRNFIAEPIFESLFGGTHTSINLDDEMQAGKLIIIDGSEAPRLYGTFWIEEVAATIRSRIKRIKMRQHVTPTIFIIDEFQDYADHHFVRILDKAREALLSGFVACHHFAQVDEEHLKQSLLTQTKVKLVARTSADSAALCRSMGMTKAEAIQTLDDYEFAYFSPGMQGAERVKFPEVDFTAMSLISEQQHEELKEMARPKGIRPPPSEPISPQGSMNPAPAETAATPRNPTPPTPAPRLDPPAVEGSEGAAVWENDVM